MHIKIRTKLILSFLTVVTVVSIFMFYSLKLYKESLLNTVVDNSENMAVSMLKRLNSGVELEIESIENLAQDPQLITVLEKSNTEFSQFPKRLELIKQRDQSWKEYDKTKISPFMSSLINHPLSEAIRQRYITSHEKKYSYQVVMELFVTNRYGANVLQTSKTSDYKQDDELWWQQAAAKTSYIGPVVYDESTNKYALTVAQKVEDRNGDFAGLIKAVVSVYEFISKVEIHSDRYRSRNVILTDEKDALIYHSDNHSFLADLSETEYSKAFAEGKKYHIANNDRIYIKANLARVPLGSGVNWNMITSYAVDEVLQPVASLQKKIFFIIGIVTVLGIIFSLYISYSFSKPIIELKKAASAFSEERRFKSLEDRGSVEIDSLNSSFQQMAADIVAHDQQLENEVERRTQ